MKKALISIVLLCGAAGTLLYSTSSNKEEKQQSKVATKTTATAIKPKEKSDTAEASVVSQDLRWWLKSGLAFQARPDDIETSGFNMLINTTEPWDKGTDLEQIAEKFADRGVKMRLQMDRFLQSGQATPPEIVETNLLKAASFQMEGKPKEAYDILTRLRSLVESNPEGAKLYLFPVIYLQGVAGLRMGENENCVMCRGESSCILPISKEAVHKNREGSLLAIKHFSEYLAASRKICESSGC